MTGQLEKLAINPCTVEPGGQVTVDRGETFTALLNPASWSHTHAIRYDRKPTLGQLAPQSEFSAVEGEKVSFDLVLDGTGVVPDAAAAGSVEEQVARLRRIVYDYDGSDHQPRPARILWGTLKFYGRLTALTVDYTLFQPSGEPLRARTRLSFVGFMSAEEEALRANRSSPDLSHRVVVREGDSLPVLCHRIYGDCAYYREVARHNGLVDLGRLRPGTVLRFPPLA